MVFDAPAAGLPPAVPVTSEFRMPQIQLGRLTVGRPTSSSLTTNESAYYILGTCDPSKKLFVNGREVEDISKEGYFGFHATLNVGVNTFRFTQEGQPQTTVTITRRTPSVTPASPMSTVDIVAGSVFPRTTNEFRRPGETVTLTCTAPIGATVRVEIGGRTYNMTPATRTAPARGAFPTTYTYQFTFPTTSVTGRLVTIGTPKYSMTYDGKEYSRDAGGALISITPGAPFYATVTSDNAYLFPNGSTTGGPKAELVRGQRDYITAVASNGDWVRLSVGGWVQGSDVSISRNETAALRSEVSSASYTVGEKMDTLTLRKRNLTATDISFDGRTLVYTVSNTSTAPRITFPNNAIVSNVRSEVRNGSTVYTMTVGNRFDGYYLTVANDTLTLNLKRRPILQTGDKPLTGISILLDPGHGGTDTGAIGPLGARLAEKHMNLALAYKLKAILESQGATVHLSRTGDTLPSLNDRVELSRRLRPDMFVSLHTNSVSESTNSSNIRGFESFFRNNIGKGISDLMVSTIRTNPLYGNRTSKQSNFFVLRPTWTPSALIETGFISNVIEFSRLTCEEEQYKLASLMASAIIRYFD
jgi:N-acetylmuramoyl-L-alanine amidase